LGSYGLWNDDNESTYLSAYGLYNSVNATVNFLLDYINNGWHILNDTSNWLTLYGNNGYTSINHSLEPHLGNTTDELTLGKNLNLTLLNASGNAQFGQNVTISQNNTFCLNIECTQYIGANSSGVVIQG